MAMARRRRANMALTAKIAFQWVRSFRLLNPMVTRILCKKHPSDYVERMRFNIEGEKGTNQSDKFYRNDMDISFHISKQVGHQ
jgi:hypothetical protein